jgi:hypothetical protein
MLHKEFPPLQGEDKGGDGPDRLNGISASSPFLRTKAKDREPQEAIIFERHERHGFSFSARDD